MEQLSKCLDLAISKYEDLLHGIKQQIKESERSVVFAEATRKLVENKSVSEIGFYVSIGFISGLFLGSTLVTGIYWLSVKCKGSRKTPSIPAIKMADLGNNDSGEIDNPLQRNFVVEEVLPRTMSRSVII